MRTYLFGLTLTAAIVAIAPSPATWTAQLSPKGGSGIRGSASVESGDAGPAATAKDPMQRDSARRDTTAYPPPESASGGAKASVSFEGAKGGAMHAWHVHQGKCSATPGPVVGDQSDYQPVTVDERGRGTGTATLRGVTLKDGEEYSVSVHGGASASDPVAACGDLRMSRGVPPANR